MEQDEIYLIDLWRIFRREWRWLVAVLAIVLACTFAYAHMAKPKWEATAWIQIGQVGAVPQGQDPRAEPLQRTIERLQSIAFQDEVVENLGLPPKSREGSLYRKSFRLDPSPYAGMIKLTIRGYTPEQAQRFASATFEHLHAIHQKLEGGVLKLAQARRDQLQADLAHALADRERLSDSAVPGGKDDATAKGAPSPALASVLLANKNEEIRGLQQAQNELAMRLTSNYTYETSLVWPIYVPDYPASPNRVLIWGMGICLGLGLGVLAAIARNALRRR
ncbi:MAG TPA: Wzz/FepE/Etk N-terminal domain-containing protein [Dyella sp.]|uniref:Wzz/FepE/Etk N-terminal domain-containing protein n=1 Tax=Dyella sp. TaxID=1869338 RepID=UPI002F94869F